MAAVANLRPVKDDAPVVSVRKGSASLGHIKEKRADGPRALGSRARRDH